MFNFNLDLDRDKKIRQQILNYPGIDQDKKEKLAINTSAYFMDVTQCTVEQAKITLNCSAPLAEQYKNQYALIDWNSDTEANKQHIKQLVTIMLSIMDWQWNPTNQETPETKPNVFNFGK